MLRRLGSHSCSANRASVSTVRLSSRKSSFSAPITLSEVVLFTSTGRAILPSAETTAARTFRVRWAESAGLQLGQFVAAIGAAATDCELVAHQLAATAGEDRWPSDQALLLLAAVNREPPVRGGCLAICYGGWLRYRCRLGRDGWQSKSV